MTAVMMGLIVGILAYGSARVAQGTMDDWRHVLFLDVPISINGTGCNARSILDDPF